MMNIFNMRFDLHVHTTLSPCSRLRLAEILSDAKSKGLDGVCITDHNTMAVREILTEGLQDDGLCIIFGLEYSTADGDFLLFGPFEELAAGLSAPQLLDRVENEGGVAIAAHPFRTARPTREYLIKQGLCRIVEGVNGRNHTYEDDRVASWEKSYDIKQVGGSDAHSLSELGQKATRFHTRITSRADLIQALKKGAFDIPHQN
jgi:predicted metal-dependent phosphoesterase TrpH